MTVKKMNIKGKLMFLVKDLSIGKKLGFAFGIILFGIIIMVTVSYITNQEIKRKVIYTKGNSIKFAILAKNMTIDVIQVQQWLTDISATRGRFGLNEGYSIAEKYAKEFRDGIHQFRTYFTNQNRREESIRIDSMLNSFENYYSMGRAMAKEYVEKGPEAGNIFMEKFDLIAENISKEITAFEKNQVDELNNDMNDVVKSTKLFSLFMLPFGLFLIIIGVFLSITVSKYYIVRPIRFVVDIIKNLSKGDLTNKINVSNNDEIGNMANLFNQFVENLKNDIKQIS